jgi:hypothetical protein
MRRASGRRFTALAVTLCVVAAPPAFPICARVVKNPRQRIHDGRLLSFCSWSGSGLFWVERSTPALSK